MARFGAGRRMLAAALVAEAALALLSGCSRPGPADGDRVAAWIDEQDWVQSASASVSTDPWSPGAGFTMSVDPAIPDSALHDLAAEAEKKAHDAGWPDPYLVWEVGQDQSFSNADRAAFPVFVALREKPQYLEVSARGNGDCGNFYCVALDDPSPGALHEAVLDLLSLAADAGGVQENLEFDAVSADGRFAVAAQPDAAVDASVALWQQIATSVPLEAARAWVVQPVGDIPAAQLLDVTVPDDVAAAAVEQLAAAQSTVEVHVTVTGPGQTTAPAA